MGIGETSLFFRAVAFVAGYFHDSYALPSSKSHRAGMGCLKLPHFYPPKAGSEDRRYEMARL